MKLRLKVAALPLSLALISGMAACSSDTPKDASPSEMSSAAVATSSASVTASASSAAPAPESSKSGSANIHTNAELEKIAAGLKDPDGEGMKVLTNAELEKGMESFKKTLAETKVSPENCQAVLASNQQVPEGFSYAGANATDVGTGAILSVALMSGPQSTVTAQMKAVDKQADSCKEFTIAIAGQSFEASKKSLNASSIGESTNASLVTEKLPDGQSLQVMVLQASKGSSIAQAIFTAPEVPEEALTLLQDLVNQALAAM